MTDASFDNKKWDSHILEQKNICERLKVEWVPTEPFRMVGLSIANSNSSPFHALRHPPDNYSGWFLWAEEYSVADDFFKTIHAWHLLEYRPEIIKYLGLPAGFRVLIDDKGYEDIWYDVSLLDV
jgi:hypothetical protein